MAADQGREVPGLELGGCPGKVSKYRFEPGSCGWQVQWEYFFRVVRELVFGFGKEMSDLYWSYLYRLRLICTFQETVVLSYLF